jgi:hypothetical protein
LEESGIGGGEDEDGIDFSFVLVLCEGGGISVDVGLFLLPNPILSALLGALTGGNLLAPLTGAGSSTFAVLVLLGSCGLCGKEGLDPLCGNAGLASLFAPTARPGKTGALLTLTNGTFLSSTSFCS